MVVFNYTMGKKVRETVGAQRLLNVFGNGFNPPRPDDFGQSPNFPVEIPVANQTTVFDMGVSPYPQPQHGGHEVPVFLTFITGIPGPGSIQITHDWFNSENNNVFQIIFDFSFGAGTARATLFSFIGWKHDRFGFKELFENSTGSPTSTRIRSKTTGTVSDIFTQEFDVIGASPNPMTQATTNSGFLWIDDSSNELMYSDGFAFVHNAGIKIESSSAQPGAKPGFLWMPPTGVDDGKLHYTSTGLKHITEKAPKEDVVLPFTNPNHAFLWCQEGTIHSNYLSFIAEDGNRYIIDDGFRDDF